MTRRKTYKPTLFWAVMVGDHWVLHDQEMLSEGLAAIEAAGWRLVPPEDGR